MFNNISTIDQGHCSDYLIATTAAAAAPICNFTTFGLDHQVNCLCNQYFFVLL